MTRGAIHAERTPGDVRDDVRRGTASGDDVPIPTRVAIIDDHTLFAETMRCVLTKAGIEVVGLATTVEEGLKLVADTEPGVVLADYRLPDGDGLQMSKVIMRAHPSTKVVVVSASDDIAQKVLVADGFSGYLTKDTPLPRFVEAIGEIADQGRIVMAPTAPRRAPRRNDTELLARHLTPREKEVLALLIKGQRGPQIALNLDISPNTVRSHIQNILTKLQVSSRLEAAAFGVRHGITEVESLRGAQSTAR